MCVTGPEAKQRKADEIYEKNCCQRSWEVLGEFQPLAVMCFYLKQWHSCIGLLFGYTCIVIVTLVLLIFSGEF